MDYGILPSGDGIAPYVFYRYECQIRRLIVLVAFRRFCHFVDAAEGSEKQKVAAAIASFAPPPLKVPFLCEVLVHNNNAGRFLHCMNCGGGTKGLLRHVLEYI